MLKLVGYAVFVCGALLMHFSGHAVAKNLPDILALASFFFGTILCRLGGDIASNQPKAANDD